MEYAIAVVDVGMTNKKVAVYDDGLRQLDSGYRSFAPRIVDGLETHDLDAMEDWILGELARAAARFDVRAVAVSTHGATFVCIGENGRAAIPCVYYTHEPGGDFHRDFYAAFGDSAELQERTGTAAFDAMINPAKGLFFAKRRFPERFADVTAVLPYPQYWGFRLTGKTGMEGTYMGCHTYLWDRVSGGLSSVARDLGIAGLLPGKLGKPWDVLGKVSGEVAERTGLSTETPVTLGIHDSNAAMLPHFAKRGEAGFTINSTGTWCVTMNPVRESRFEPGELGRTVFFNISALGTPVKTAIFMGGLEMESWSRLLMARHGRSDFPAYDEALCRSLLSDADCFLFPGIVKGSGLFPDSTSRIVEGGRAWTYGEIEAGDFPPCFGDYERGFAVLRISLVMQSLSALEMTGLIPGTDVITEGGFRRDDAYNRLLSSSLPECPVFLTDIAEASALGAAMTARMAISGVDLAGLSGDLDVGYIEVGKSAIPEFASYRRAWLELV